MQWFQATHYMCDRSLWIRKGKDIYVCVCVCVYIHTHKEMFNQIWKFFSNLIKIMNSHIQDSQQTPNPRNMKEAIRRYIVKILEAESEASRAETFYLQRSKGRNDSRFHLETVQWLETGASSLKDSKEKTTT